MREDLEALRSAWEKSNLLVRSQLAETVPPLLALLDKIINHLEQNDGAGT